MSHYQTNQIDMKDGESIIAALEALNIEYERADDLTRNSVTLHNTWGHGHTAAAIVVQKDAARRHGLGSCGGIAFVWDAGQYHLAQDELDMQAPRVVKTLGQLKQHYGVHKAAKVLKRQGWIIKTEEKGGVVTMTASKL